MSDKTTAAQEPAAELPTIPFWGPAIVLEAWRPLLAGNAEMSGAVTDAFSRMGREWTDFVSRRLTEDLGLSQRLAACKSPMEMWSTYIEFWQKAAEDYARECAALTQCATAVLDTGAAAQRRSRQTPMAAIPPAKAA
ncbi:MAG: phasin family protein [Hyphomicrobiaceae bacterium]|nr:MAG: phasin family protein [Hyphomicrobiaceae bacterium]